MAEGWVYILINPSLQKDLLKIGKTVVSTEQRAKQLSSSGVPTDFHVAYDVKVNDCHKAENLIHKKLESYRYKRNREFFKLPLKKAIPILEETAKEVGKISEQKSEKKLKPFKKRSSKSTDIYTGRENFEKLADFKTWQDECKKMNELTNHRKEQLMEILKRYGGTKIPFTHFTDEMVKDFSLRNSEAYPAICAYLAGILVKEEDGLVLKEELRKDLNITGTRKRDRTISRERHSFWNSLLEKANQKTSLHSKIKAISKPNGIHTSAGRSGITFGYVGTKDKTWVELNINIKGNWNRTQEIYDAILSEKDSIVRKYPELKVIWSPPKEPINSRMIISYSEIGGIGEKDKWDEIQNDLIERMIKFSEVFKKVIDELSS